MGRNNVEYAVYRGDDLLCIGTAQECADQMGIKYESFIWYKTPIGKKRVTNRKNPAKNIFIEKLEDE